MRVVCGLDLFENGQSCKSLFQRNVVESRGLSELVECSKEGRERSWDAISNQGGGGG